MSKTKKILAAITSTVVIAGSLTLSSSAYDNKVDAIMINGYECYESEGQLITNVDGEDCIVLVASEENKVTDETLIAELNARAGISSIQTRAIPQQWPNSSVVDISDGSKYNGSGDITNSNYLTPMFITNPDDDDVALKIYSGFVFPTTYKVKFYWYIGDSIKEWYNDDIILTFGLFNQTRTLLTGTPSQYISKCCFEYDKSSTGEKKFDYQFWQD